MTKNFEGEQKAFLICSPGLEALVELELADRAALIRPRIHSGSLEIEADLQTICELALTVKVATRVLLQVAEFKARDFPKLYNHLKKMPWPLWLGGAFPEVSLSAKSCRVFHSDRFNETVQSAIAYSYKSSPPKKKSSLAWGELTPKVYFRGQDDKFTISLDLTGVGHHHWPSKIQSKASLRDTLASAILLKLRALSPEKKTGVWDPMMGRGTFLLANFNWDNEVRHRHCRSFPFGPKNLPKKRGPLEGALFKDYTASEISELGVEQALENIETCLQERPELDITCDDFFKISPKRPSLLVLNPPYGLRLKAEKGLLAKIAKRINELIEKELLLGGVIVTPYDQGQKLIGLIHGPTEKELTVFKSSGLTMSLLSFAVDASEYAP